MALIDKASLLMVPSTYEAGTLYNVLPSGNRAPDNKGGAGYDQTRADFTFDRGTDHGATRIGSDGLIKKYRENKLLQSNQFDTTWVNYQSAETGGQPDKDGGSTAWKLTRLVDGANGVLYQTGLSFSLATFSVYAKSAEENWIYIEGVGSTFPAQFFDLQNGVKGTASGTGFVDSNIVSVGDGWHRISITFNISGGNRVSIYQATADNTLSGSIGDGVYIMNAQVETGMVSTDYLDSGATTAKAGVLIDLPRINYDANGENGALLLEPQRTNDIPHSEYLNAVTKSNVTITTNAATSPEGNKNAHNVVANATNSDHLFFQSSMGGSTNANTQTIYAKANGYDWIHIRFDLPTRRAFFNVANGTLGTADSGVVHTIEDAGNGWYRCSATMTTTSYVNAVVGLASDDATANFLGDGTSGVLMYGWQSEEASYATSYIPNMGESGGVTRAADSCLKTGVSDLINDGDGTLYMEVTPTNFEGDQRFGISDNIGANRIVLRLFNPSNLQLSCVINSSVEVSIFNSGYSAGNTYKIAGAWKENDAVIYINGVQVATDTNCNITPSNPLTRISFDNGVGTAKWENPVTQTMYFPTRLTNSELATLTTL